MSLRAQSTSIRLELGRVIDSLRSEGPRGCIVPIRFTLDPTLNILITTLQGLISFDDIEKHLDEEAARGFLGYPEICDATEASTNLTDDQARAIVARLRDMAESQAFGATAVVTQNDVFFGMVMMIKILSELRGGPRIGVFRSMAAGLDWIARA